ncbi:MAG TPA: amino acid adenylation domain-containing protein, partial [Pilimelia sp.]|nr:amino acid adenylation domain-containing protein [Pilimelia sp.]
FMVMLAGLQALLARLSGQDDICVGSPFTLRSRPELAEAVGLFVNSLPLRTDLSGDPALADVVRRAKQTCVAALDHADLPFDQIVAAARVPHDPSRNPLFQVMLVQNPAPPSREAGELAFGRVFVRRQTSRLDLTMLVEDSDTAPRIEIDYNADLFDAETIDRFVERFLAVLAALVAEPGRRLSTLDVRTGQERRAQHSWQGTHRSYPAVSTVAELIAARAAEQPGAPAVIAGHTVLSYGELDAAAGRFARRLRAAGVGPEVPVGLALPASPAAVVAVLGILKAGGAYLPLDPAHPPARLAAVLDDARAPVLVAADTGLVPGYAGRVLTPEGPDAHDTGTGVDAGFMSTPARPDQLAYVVYTSGSTGQPKGVMVSHRTLLNLTHAFIETHGFTATDRILMLPPLTFDASVGDIFPALVSGAALALHDRPAELTGQGLLDLCDRRGITVVDAAAPLWRRWVADLAAAGGSRPVPTAGLQLMMIGGEAVSAAVAREWAALTGGRVVLVNHYGPTEGTVCATVHHVVDGAEAATHLPIGSPLPNVRVHLLDPDQRPVPVGVVGEVYLGGAAPARGYIGAPALTADRFVPDPFARRPGERLYRTGDLARHRADGVLEFVGRVDRQVKIRGHRVELGEVEAAVAGLAGVRQAAVTARDTGGTATRLVAYVVCDGPADPAGWRAALRERLPEYLLPAAFVALPELPLNRHGKLDEAALPAPASTGALPAHVPPRTATEKALAELWATVIGQDCGQRGPIGGAVSPIAVVGAHDNFFDVGGHSLLAAPLVARIEAELGVALPIRAVFEAADLAALAELIDAEPAASGRRSTVAGGLEATLRADAVLPDDVCAGLPAGDLPGRPRTALLTGATGFLGAYLLHDLLAAGGVARAYCLVRAATPDAAVARVADNLRRYGLWRDEYVWRLVGVPGDLAAPDFGLAARDADALADAVDAIYHNGGMVDFLRPYAMLRPANVGGTLAALRLAGRGRPAAFHLVSTLGVYLTPGLVGHRVRETDPPADCAGLTDGYNASKWVADALAREARDRGLRVCVYRPARVAGHSATGAGNVEDYFSRLLATCVQLGAVPDVTERADLAPVDYVGTAIGHLSRVRARASGGAMGGDFHFYGGTVTFGELAGVLHARGYPARLVPYADWRAALLARPDAALAAFAPLLPPDSAAAGARPDFDCTATESAAAALGVRRPPVDAALLHRYVDHLVRVGFIHPPAPGSAHG